MCGIGGILRITPPGEAARAAAALPLREAIPEAWLDILDESIRHRGPDGQGRFRDRAVRADGAVVDVALVHRRLSIIDHAGGTQPMVAAFPRAETEGRHAGSGSEQAALLFHAEPDDLVHYQRTPGAESVTGFVAVVFNGCIYNHRELRRELQAAGHQFVTDHSDTEVILQGWRQWRTGVFERLNGMFGIGLWDGRTGMLTVARDGFGEKPLYSIEAECEGSTLIAFSCCVPGLLRIGSLDGVSVSGYWRSSLAGCVRPWILFGWNQAPSAPSLHEIRAGQITSWPEAQPDDHTSFGHHSWTAPWSYEFMNPTGQQLTEADVDTLLRRAVHSRLEADVSLGLFLSGGIDSALIAAYASEVRPDISAYTVRMPETGLDESAAAARTASHLHIRHHILDCDPKPAEDLVTIIRQLGLPFGDSSLLPSLWVSRAARAELRVALAGDGGDELYLGYDRHVAMKWLRRLGRLPHESRQALAHAASIGGGRGRRLDRVSRLLNASAHGGYKDLVAVFPQPYSALLGLMQENGSGWSETGHFGMTFSSLPPADESMMDVLSLRFDRAFYLPCDLLRKTDTASMSAALEVRAPMLEPDHARAAINAPISCLMPKGRRKGLLRQVARRYLPAEIVDRPKMGFAIPIGDWFRTDYGGLRTLLYDRLSSREPFGPDALGINSMINMGYVRRMLREHDDAGGRGIFPWKGRDHSQRLYMLLVLSIWADWLARVRSSSGSAPRA
ncbi:MAG: hypothetical protein KF745_05590 [Phycisphaeraceae bacterium]|nr:hypothetical protein [Phycisphaeraceae bacterium]